MPKVISILGRPLSDEARNSLRKWIDSKGVSMTEFSNQTAVSWGTMGRMISQSPQKKSLTFGPDNMIIIYLTTGIEEFYPEIVNIPLGDPKQITVDLQTWQTFLKTQVLPVTSFGDLAKAMGKRRTYLSDVSAIETVYRKEQRKEVVSEFNELLFKKAEMHKELIELLEKMVSGKKIDKTRALLITLALFRYIEAPEKSKKEKRVTMDSVIGTSDLSLIEILKLIADPLLNFTLNSTSKERNEIRSRLDKSLQNLQDALRGLYSEKAWEMMIKDREEKMRREGNKNGQTR